MNKSDSIAALATALSKAQAEIKDATKDVVGRGYKYADLGQILNIIRPIFSKHNLAVTQFPCDSESNDSLSVETILMHESGEWIGNKFSMPVEQIMSNAGKPVTSKAQAAGSVITYARRYALAAVAGITQEDNDASIQREEKKQEESAGAAKKDHDKALSENISSVACIKEGIAKGDLIQAAEAWFELLEDIQRALWLATSKGGVFTTSEREVMKNELRKAYAGDQK